MKQITVAARKRDPRVFTVQKYSNDEPWNTVGGTAPSGVHATRYLRRTQPILDQLSPLARFIVENGPTCVAGKWPSFNSADRVRCYNGETQADTARRTNQYGALTENMIRVYNLENSLTSIDDYLFDVIEPHQTDEQYWNDQAERIVAIGTCVVEIGKNRFEVKK